MNWNILKIEATTDLDIIAKAYREQLKNTNPEDKPEEFKQLRAAYEEALELAKNGAVDKECGPLDLWKKKLADLYDNFSSRIQLECWQELFQDDVCVAIDMRPKAEEILFNFLQSNWILPQEVWSFIIEQFAVQEKLEEMYSNYGKDFIDYAVIGGAQNPKRLPLDLFTPGVNGQDCDDYYRLYIKLQETMDNGDDVNDICKEMDGLSESHPYGLAQKFRLQLNTEQDEIARKGLLELAEQYPDDSALVMYGVNIYLEMNKNDEAKQSAQHLLDIDSTNYSAQFAMAECIFREGDYVEAKDKMYLILNQLSNGSPVYRTIADKLRQWNEIIIEKLEQKENLDIKNRTELAWCYLQNERIDDCISICDDVQLDMFEDPYDYYNLLVKAYFSGERYQDSYDNCVILIEYLKNLKNDGTEKIERELKRLPEFVQIETECLRHLGREDEAQQVIDEATEMNANNVTMLLRRGYDYLQKNDYYAALDLYNRAIEMEPDSPIAHYFKSRALFGMHHDKEAYDEINDAIAYDSAQLRYYTHKLDILIRNGIWSEAHQIMDLFKQSEIPQLCIYDWYEARLIEEENNDADLALEKYQQIALKIENGKEIEAPADLYYRICSLIGDKFDWDYSEDYSELYELLDKGLSYNPEHIQCLYYKAWLLKNEERIPEALELYHKLEQYPTHSSNIETALADIYYQDLNKNADKALKYYEILQQNDPDDADVYFYIGFCQMYLNEYELAQKSFEKEIELCPEDVDGYYGLIRLQEYKKDYAEELRLIDKALPMYVNTNAKCDMLKRKYKILCRMGMTEDACATLDVIKEINSEYEIFEYKFDAYSCMGMWDEADAVLKEWEKSKESPAALANCKIKHALSQGKVHEAKEILSKLEYNINDFQLCQRRNEIAEFENDWDVEIEYYGEKLKESPDWPYFLLGISFAYYNKGDKEKSVVYAKKALITLEQKIKEDKESEAINRSQYAMSLALCGRIDEAKQALEKASEVHLCTDCIEMCCTDVDLFEIKIEEMCGNYERALQIARDGVDKRCRDCEFIIAARRLENKVRNE